MSSAEFEALRHAIMDDAANAHLHSCGWQPVYSASAHAKIAIISHAPGRKAQSSGVPWDDASGATLMSWLGVSEAQFRDPDQFAQLPMDFYYPGRGASGDLPPRQDFAPRWHPPLLTLMPQIRLTLLVGRHAQAYYLPAAKRATLTATVRDYRAVLPDLFPIVHPSPLNFRWHGRNPWFVTEVLPDLRRYVSGALAGASATRAGPSSEDAVD